MALHRRDLLAAVGILAAIAPAGGLAPSGSVDRIIVRAPRGAVRGTLALKRRTYPCVLGRAGIVVDKREGDGGTPSGCYPLREVRYRPDHMARPQTTLPVIASTPADGWCDDPADPAYNTAVQLPYRASAEALWRDDGAYDLLAVVGCNDHPPAPGKGSAIFLHIARNGVDGSVLSTAGCIALERDDLAAVLAAVTRQTVIDIGVA